MFCGVFIEDKKLDSNLHICDCNMIHLFTSRKRNLDFCSTFKIRLLVESSYIKTNDLFQYQTRTTEWFDMFSRMHFVRVLCNAAINVMPKGGGGEPRDDVVILNVFVHPMWGLLANFEHKCWPWDREV